MSKFVQSPFVIMAILISITLSDCLDPETLTSLGFFNQKDMETNMTLCPLTTANSTSCVSQSQLFGIYNFLQQNMSSILNSSNQLLSQLTKLKSAFQNNYPSYLELNIQMLKKPIITFNKIMSVVQKMPLNPFLVINQPQRNLNLTVSNDPIITNNDTILANYQYLVTYLNDINDQAISDQKTCLLSYFNITFATYCLLGSSKWRQALGSGQVNNTENIGVFTNTPTVGRVLAGCISLVEVYCLMNYGVSVSDLVFTDSNSNSDQKFQNSILTKETCLQLQSFYNCSNPFCFQQKSAILINNVFSFSAVSFLASKVNLGWIGNSVNQVMAILNLFGANEILEPSLWPSADNLTVSNNSFQSEIIFLVADNYGGFFGPEGGDTGASFTFAAFKSIKVGWFFLWIFIFSLTN